MNRTTLRVILDPLTPEHPGAIARYTEELTRALIATAPAGCDVAAVLSAPSADTLHRIHTLLPGLSETIQLPLPAPLVTAAWAAGVTNIPGRTESGERRKHRGMNHATTARAPLSRHDRTATPGNQTVITIHSAAPWTHPRVLPGRHVLLQRALGRRARRHADAIVVPSHSVAEQLTRHIDVADRIRVIPGAVSPRLRVPVDADTRATRIGLPDDYLLALGPVSARRRTADLIRSLATPGSVDLPLVIAGPTPAEKITALATEAGLPEGRVIPLGFLPDADLAVVIERAAALVQPSITSGFGLPILEAFSLGTPVIHSDIAAFHETADGAGHTIPDSDDYPAALARTISDVLDDPRELERMRLHGPDRARAFTWDNSAHQVWQLHADL